MIQLEAEVVERKGEQNEAELRRDEALRMKENFQKESIAANADLAGRSLQEVESLKADLEAAAKENEATRAESASSIIQWQVMERIKDGKATDLAVQLTVAQAELRAARERQFDHDDRIPRDRVLSEINAETYFGNTS